MPNPENLSSDDLARFWSKVDADGDCWLWLGSRDSYGYGAFSYDGGMAKAHRVGYQILVGLIPGGLPLDHLCRVPACVNPDHLEPVSDAVNLSRGRHPKREQTACIHGHPFDDRNTRIDPKRGWRICRACHLNRERVRRTKAAS